MMDWELNRLIVEVGATRATAVMAYLKNHDHKESDPYYDEHAAAKQALRDYIEQNYLRI